MKIREKLTLQFIAIVSTLLLISLLTIYYFSRQYRKHEFYNQLIKKASTTADLLFKVREVDSALLKIIDINRKDIYSNENISVYNYANEEIYTNNDSLDFRKLLPDLSKAIQHVRTEGELKSSSDKMEIIGIPYTYHAESYVIIAGATDQQGLINLKNLKNMLSGIFVFLLLVVGLSGWIYSGRALSPILKVVNEVDKITESNLNLRLDEGHKKDEIEKLSTTFNKMLERIENAFTLQKTFIANASHELRNPLTKITSQLEVALLNERDNESYKKIISSVLEDIRNLNEVSHRLLQLTKLKSEEAGLTFGLIRIDDLIWETKAEFLSLHPGYKVNFYLDHLPENENLLKVKGNASFLKTCFSNLMENGCKFSTDKTVTVSLLAKIKQFEIVFKNNGLTIDPQDIPYIFEPFYRSKNSSGTGGYGIGLSLVKRIVTLHNGSIALNSLPGEETVFTIILPVAEF